MSREPAERCLSPLIVADLRKKMVFAAGPRQVGKTTLSRSILGNEPRGVYLNFDRADDRRTARAARWPADSALIVLDELDKQNG